MPLVLWRACLLLALLAAWTSACSAKVSSQAQALFSSACAPDADAAPCDPSGLPSTPAPQLTFAVVGDTRPANEDDTAGYPTAIIDAIFTDVAALNPRPSFVISTGDYEFASPQGSQSGPQLDLYMNARAKFPGVMLPAMGNHECTGATASNCGLGNKDGFTANYTAFLERMLWPIHETMPYYAAHFDAADGSWTSKLVFIAANAWDEAQATWLEATLSSPTTYTFVVRHEPPEAKTAPGTTPSEACVTRHPFTLEICGHSHTYSRKENRVVIGNGGAPLTAAKGYGYGLVRRRSDGTIEVDEVDYETGQVDPSFHFAVTPDGVVVESALAVP